MTWKSYTSIESFRMKRNLYRTIGYQDTQEKISFNSYALKNSVFWVWMVKTQTIDVIARKHDMHLLYTYSKISKETELDSEYRLSIYARKQLFYLLCCEKLSFWGLDAKKVKYRCGSQET